MKVKAVLFDLFDTLLLVLRKAAATDTSKPANTNIELDLVVKSLKEVPKIISDC
ncbi:MAG: hypothetical protein QXZ47_05615 [Candidatus Bathyarchaeia archaeon]